MENIKSIQLAPEFVLNQYNQLKKEYDKLTKENYDLKTKLNYEKTLRQQAESELNKIQEQKRKRRTKKELEDARKNDIEVSEFKTNGVKKASAAEYIPSYSCYQQIMDCIDNMIKDAKPRYKINHIRNKVLIQVGLNFGIRCGDLIDLKWKNVLNNDFTFKTKVKIIEDKTSKFNKLLITEFIKQTLTDYLIYLQENNYQVSLDDYIFSNFLNGNHISRNAIYDYMTSIQNELGLKFHFSTHTMRKTCVNVAICVDKTKVNTDIISKAQLLLNHNSSDTTMHYLNVTDKVLDTMREKVSDWLMGKTDIDELVLTDENGIENQVLNQIKDLLEKAI